MTGKEMVVGDDGGATGMARLHCFTVCSVGIGFMMDHTCKANEDMTDDDHDI